MSTPSNERDPQPASPRPAWPPHQFFCIHSYAGEAGPPCAWRGLALETLRDAATGVRHCPRCGRATLMEIPPPPLKLA